MTHPYHSASCGCDHDTLEQAQLDTLYPSIDTLHIRCYNEQQEGQARQVIRPYEERHTHSMERGRLNSPDDDAELLLFIPFITNVKIKTITVMCEGDQAPDKVRIYVNREDLDLSSAADTQPTQELDLAEDPRGEIDYMTKLQKFQNVSSLWLYFPSNSSPSSPESQTSIHWLHLKGVASKDRREIANVVYEAIARPSDHPVKDQQHVRRTIQ